MSEEKTASPEDPGFEKLPDGTIVIGPEAARASMKRAEKEAFEHGSAVVEGINAETAGESGRAPGDAAGGTTQ